MKIEIIQTSDPYPEAIVMNVPVSPIPSNAPASKKKYECVKKEPAFDPSSRAWKMQSVAGDLHLVASDRGLEWVGWERRDVPELDSLPDDASRATSILAQAVRELAEYFAGKRRKFEVPLAPAGTEFQRAVWAELMKIPYGETTSYAEIARRLDKERAVRAVGTANARNPFCVIIPCHRVIASNGTIAGYAGGVPTKEKLIALEKEAAASGG